LNLPEALFRRKLSSQFSKAQSMMPTNSRLVAPPEAITDTPISASAPAKVSVFWRLRDGDQYNAPQSQNLSIPDILHRS
jgi:hypothetical protein